eukprot:1872342-Prorocentrum_lima.AAC.1
MTSSLVGSEMCIRDRDEGAIAAQGVGRLVGLEGCVETPAPPVNRNEPNACLLYTSDAADDM